jgi:hypothetical protein
MGTVLHFRTIRLRRTYVLGVINIEYEIKSSTCIYLPPWPAAQCGGPRAAAPPAARTASGAGR